MNFVVGFKRPLALSFILLSSASIGFSPAWGVNPPQEDPTEVSASSPTPQQVDQKLYDIDYEPILSAESHPNILSYLPIEILVRCKEVSWNVLSSVEEMMYPKVCDFINSALNDNTPTLKMLFDVITQDMSDLPTRLSKVTDLYVPLSKGQNVMDLEDFLKASMKNFTVLEIKRCTSILRYLYLLPEFKGEYWQEKFVKEALKVDAKDLPDRVQATAKHMEMLFTPDMDSNAEFNIIIEALKVDAKDLPEIALAIAENKEKFFRNDISTKDKCTIIRGILVYFLNGGNIQDFPERAQAIEEHREMLFIPEMEDSETTDIIIEALKVDARDLPGRAQAIADHIDKLFTPDMNYDAKELIIIEALKVDARDLPGRVQAILENKEKLFTPDMEIWEKADVMMEALTLDAQDLPGRAQAILENRDKLFTPDMWSLDKLYIIQAALQLDAQHLPERAQAIAENKEMLFMETINGWEKQQIICIALRVDIEDVSSRIKAIDQEINTFLTSEMKMQLPSSVRSTRSLALKLEANELEKTAKYIKENMPTDLETFKQKQNYIEYILMNRNFE